MNEKMIVEIDPTKEQMELIPHKKLDLQEIFVKGIGIDTVLDAIREKVFNIGQDVSDKDNRELVKSTAYKIARSKTFLDGLGKDVVAEEKKKVDATNANRKKIRDTLEALQKEYRKPLTDYEEAEKKREEEEAEKLKRKVEGWVNKLFEIDVIKPYHELAIMIDEEFDEFYQQEKVKFDERIKSIQRESALRNINVFKSGDPSETLITTHDDFVFSGSGPSDWKEVLILSDEDFNIFLETLKKELKEFSNAKEAKAKADAEALEKEKAQIRKQREEIRTHLLIQTGFEFKNDYFKISLPVACSSLHDEVIITLNDVLDFEPDEFSQKLEEWERYISNAHEKLNKIKDERTQILTDMGFIFENNIFSLDLTTKNESINVTLEEVLILNLKQFENSTEYWNDLIKMDKELSTTPEWESEKPQETEPEECPEVPVKEDIETEISSTPSDTDNDITQIADWIGNIAICVNQYPTCKTNHAAVIVDDIRASLNEFIQKINEGWIKELKQ